MIKDSKKVLGGEKTNPSEQHFVLSQTRSNQ